MLIAVGLAPSGIHQAKGFRRRLRHPLILRHRLEIIGGDKEQPMAHEYVAWSAHGENRLGERRIANITGKMANIQSPNSQALSMVCP